MANNDRKWLLGALVVAAALALGLWVWQHPAGPRAEARTGRTDTAQPQASSGAGPERGQVQENVEYIIRDAKGRIKDHKVVGGQ